MSARFIVLEGPDGSGTTRHSEFLVERLQREGLQAIRTAEPTDTPLGKHIRELLKSDRVMSPEAVQLLFSADRAEHLASVILPALESGAHVVCDRYALSTIVYGAAAGLDAAWLTEVNRHFRKPDITILALPPFEVCKERMMRREHRDQFENEDFQRKVYEEYRTHAGDAVIVDTSGELRDTADQIWDAVKPLL